MNTLPSTIQTLPEDAALIALGANLPSDLGAPRQTLLAAVAALAELGTAAPQCSRLYRTRPVDCPPGSPDFINGVALLRVAPDTSPEALLTALQGLEARFGRRRGKQANAARSLDLDLLALGTCQRRGDFLTLPHPRAAERSFVLAPLVDLLPALRLPGWPVSAQELLDALPASGLEVLPDRS